MKVSIIESRTKSKIKASISLVTRDKLLLPSINDGWRFNFNKHSKQKDYKTYTLTTLSTPKIVEGCLIINLENNFEVYMAYIEVAPHNRGDQKKYDHVAGCLIAFACKQSFIHDKEGYVAFHVHEEHKENEIKLMELYTNKYNALRLGDSTTMIIIPEESEKLIERFLK